MLAGKKLVRSVCIISSIVVFLITNQISYACVEIREFDVNYVKHADVVVIGRVSNYKIIRGRKGWGAEYARFNVEVSDRFKGVVPNEFSATWDNSTFGVPDKMESGPFLIALRDPSSQIGANGEITPTPEPDTRTVLQKGCSSPFILRLSNPSVAEIKTILNVKATQRNDKATSRGLGWPLIGLMILVTAAFGVIWIMRRRQARMQGSE